MDQESLTDIEYVGVGKLRKTLTTDMMQGMRRPLVVTGPNLKRPLGVVITWDYWLDILSAMRRGA